MSVEASDRATSDMVRAHATGIIRSNRGQGLVSEIMDMIDAEESALALEQIAVALRSLTSYAAGRAFTVEHATHEIERARHVRRPRTRRWRLV